jgi:hypothetical protein
LAIVSNDRPQIRSLLAWARVESAVLRIEPLAQRPICLAAGKGMPFGR